jgi:hypothetical protein
VIRSPGGEPALAEEHKLGCENEGILSREDDRRCYCVLDTCHYRGRGYPQVLDALRERDAVLESGVGDPLRGVEPAREQ